jgi:hypothetical protein
VKKEGDNQGRRFFKCQDCDFFQWAGERGACANPNTDAELDQPAKRPKPNGAHDGLFDNAIDLDDEELGGSSARGAGARGRGGGGGRGRGGGGGGGGGGGAPSAPHGGGARGGKGGGGKGGRKKKCDKGAACPYQHEHQHCAEYSHPTDEPPAGGGEAERAAANRCSPDILAIGRLEPADFVAAAHEELAARLDQLEDVEELEHVDLKPW